MNKLNSFSPKKIQNKLFFLLFFSFIVRTSVPFFAFIKTNDTKVFWAPDTGSYVESAKELLKRCEFSINGVPIIERTPGYPLFLAAIRTEKYFELVTIILQVCISVATVFLVYKIALLIFGSQSVSIICAFFYSIEPLSILYTSKILTETLFTFLFLLFVFFLLKFFEQKRIILLILSAIFLVFTSYVRPITSFLHFFLVPIFFIKEIIFKENNKENFNRNKYVITTGYAVLFVSIVFLLQGIWQFRNKIVADYWGFSSIGDINLYFYHKASILSIKTKKPFYEVQKEMGYSNWEVYFKNHPKQINWSKGEIYKFMRKDSIRTILYNFGLFHRIYLKGAAYLMLEPGAFDFMKLYKLYPESGGILGEVFDKGILKVLTYLLFNKPIIFWANFFLGILNIIFIFTAVIFIFLKGNIKFYKVTLIYICLYLIIFSSGVNANSRFRHPIMPFISMFAGYSFCKFFGVSNVKERKK